MSKLKNPLQFPSNPQNKDKNLKGFSTALLFNLSPLRSTLPENQDANDNIKLNSSASPTQGESSSMLNDFLSSDLIQKINQLSPIAPSDQGKSHISDVCLENCKDNISSNDEIDQDDLLSCSSSGSLELKEDKEIPLKLKKSNKMTFGVSSMGENKKIENANCNNISKKDNKDKDKDKEKDKDKDNDRKLNKSYNETVHILDKEKLTLPKLKKCSSNIKQDDDNEKNISNGNNSNNKSNIFSYYDSTSRYLSQALQEEQDKDQKMTDNINNSHNYIPKSNVFFNGNNNNNNSNNLSNSEISMNNPFKGDNFFHSPDSPNYAFVNKSNTSNNQFDVQQSGSTNIKSTNQNSQLDQWQNNDGINIYSKHKQIFKDENQLQSNLYYNYMNQMIIQQQKMQNANMNINTNMNNFYSFDNQIDQEEFEIPSGIQGNFNYINKPQFDILEAKKTKAIQNNNKKFNNKKSNLKKKKNNEQEEQNEIKDRPEEYLLEMFGRIGWICNQCNNFNYESKNYIILIYIIIARIKCNRCSIPKNPKKLSEIKKKKESDIDKKRLKEHKGDWICPNCQNLNFGFRIVCNRCQIPRDKHHYVIEVNSGTIQNQQILRKQMEENYANPFQFHMTYSMQHINNSHININNFQGS